ncbi:MAG: hypothetical protein GWN58_44070, partial [Anaerolineae bacterium]|nr:hypothetical protein [Anaerolineae bacterium]
MKKANCQRTSALMLFALLLALFASQDAGATTFVVNCGTGQSLGQVLKVAAQGSTIKLTGVCQERVIITTDGITLDGEGSAIIEGEGVGPFPSEFDPVVTIDGAHGVTLKGLTVQNGPGEGVLAKNGASFRLENVTAQNNGNTGIVVSTNSTGELEAVTSQDNLFGLRVFDSAAVILHDTIALTHNLVHGLNSQGNSSVELRPAQLNASNNGGFGLVIDSVEFAIFGFAASQGSSITANDNGGCGLAIISSGRLVVVSPPPFFGSGI